MKMQNCTQCREYFKKFDEYNISKIEIGVQDYQLDLLNLEIKSDF